MKKVYIFIFSCGFKLGGALDLIKKIISLSQNDL